MDRAANLLGALALAVSDRQRAAVTEVAGGESSAAALSALDQFLDAPSVDLLRQVLGLTHSGAVRLLDRLEASGQVTRRPGPDGRTVAVHLTVRGRRTARRVSQARADALTAALEPLTGEQRRAFEDAAGTALAGTVRQIGATRWTCRLCDLTACGRAAGDCPVANEARRLHGDAVS